MRYRNLFLGGILIFAVTLVYTALVYSRLPAQIPTHWNINGHVDQYSDRWPGAFFSPAMQLGMLVLFLLLPVISPKKASLDNFAGTYSTICLYVLGFLGYVQFLTLQAALGPFDVSKAIVCGVFVLLGLMGNLLTRAKRNYWIGIRTPWTLESEDVWNRTHRFGGRLLVAASLVGLVGTLIGAPLWTMFAIVMAASLAPVVYSFLIYRRTSGV